jgi:hypothetical protein
MNMYESVEVQASSRRDWKWNEMKKKWKRMGEAHTSIGWQELARLDLQRFVSSEVNASVRNDAQQGWQQASKQSSRTFVGQNVTRELHYRRCSSRLAVTLQTCLHQVYGVDERLRYGTWKPSQNISPSTTYQPDWLQCKLSHHQNYSLNKLSKFFKLHYFLLIVKEGN